MLAGESSLSNSRVVNLEDRDCILNVTLLTLERMCPSQGEQVTGAQDYETRRSNPGFWRSLQIPCFAEAPVSLKSEISVSMEKMELELGIRPSC